MRILFWSGLTILSLGVLRTLAVLIRGIADGNTATIIVNAIILPITVALVFVLWRTRDNLRM